MEINFVHISDMHLHFVNYDSEKMRRELMTYLSNLSDTVKFDMLIITGDLTHQGQKFTSEIDRFLQSIITCMRISKEQVYLVPGNHDLQRDEVRSLMIQGIKGGANPTEQLDKAINIADTRNILYKSFKGFFKFYKQFLGEDYPKNEVHFIRSNEKCNIVHINTCLIAYSAKEESTLLVAKHKLLSCLEKLEKNSQKLNIAIGHHTLDCMTNTDKKAMQTNFDDYCIDMYLSGHVHKPNYDIEVNGNNSILHVVSGAGLVDSYANGGFVTAKISTSSAKADFQYHSWNQENSYWKINNDVGRKVKTGILSYEVKRFQEQTVSSISEEGDFNEDEFKRFIIDFHQYPQKKEMLKSIKVNKSRLSKNLKR